MPFISKERVSLSGSLIVGNRELSKDKQVAPLKYGEPMQLESFGFFETSSPNFNTYYPDIKAEDLAPKDEEYVYPTFRGLSECIVRPQWPIDFGATDALRNSMHLLRGIAVYPNHEMITGDELGVVYSVEWQENRTINTKSGKLQIPAGINLVYKIDGKSNPRIARNLMSDPPAIHSTSLTVEFKWEKSHTELSDEEFWNKLGTYDRDGSLIKRNVIEILRYYEASLVPHGADPFAKILDSDGNPATPESIKATYKFSEFGEDKLLQSPLGPIYTQIDWRDKSIYYTESLSEDNHKNSIPNQSNNKNNPENFNTMSKLQALLEACVALQAIVPKEVTTDEQFVEWLTAKNTELSGVTTELQTLKQSLEKATGDLATANKTLATKETELTGVKSQLSEIVAAQRTEAIRLYTLCSDNKTDETMLKVIQESDYKTSLSFLEQYKKLAKEKFGDSVDLRNSGKRAEDGDGGEKPLSLEEASESLLKDKTRVNTKFITDNNK